MRNTIPISIHATDPVSHAGIAAQHARAVEALKKKARRLGLQVTENAAETAAGPTP